MVRNHGVTLSNSPDGASNRRITADWWLALAAILSLALAAAALTARRYDQWLARPYRTGDSLRDLGIKELSWTGPPEAAVVLFVDSSCQPCIETMPFYKTLRSVAGRVRVVLLGQEPVDLLLEFARSFDVDVDSAVSVKGELGRLRRTPTTLLLDRNGVVRWVQVGRLSNDNGGRELVASIQLLNMSDGKRR